MKCMNCGNELADNSKFCSECGTKIEETSKIELECKKCGGTLTITAGTDRTVLICPFCKSAELLDESDKVMVQRIKSNTYKEVELEKLRFEENKERNEKERIEKEEKEKKAYTEKYSKLAIVCFIMASFCVLLAVLAFRSNVSRIAIGVFRTVQAIIFFIAGFIGRKNFYNKTQTKHKLIAIFGFVFVLFTLKSPFPTIEKEMVVIPTISYDTVTNEEEGIYCYEIRDYFGRNAASIGTGSEKQITEDYGKAKLKIVFLADDGEYLAPLDTKKLREYVVYDQSLAVGSKLIAVSERYSNGLLSTTEYQNYEELLLFVHKVGTEILQKPNIIAISPTQDRRTYHIRDYMGRNAASVGFYNGNKRYETYGPGKIEIVFSTKDGTYLDTSKNNLLEQYVVIDQDIDPNTKLTYTFYDHPDGEISNVVEYQSHKVLNVLVEKIPH